MVKGVDIADVVPGTGEVATRESIVSVRLRAFLHRGDEVPALGGEREIELYRREEIPGLRRGIEGMAVGGQRTLIIAPHLAYREGGWPGVVPGNSLLRYEVELLEVLHLPKAVEDDNPRHYVCVECPGELATGTPRWVCCLEADGRCNIRLTRPPRETTSWKDAPYQDISCRLDEATTSQLFQVTVGLANTLSNRSSAAKKSTATPGHRDYQLKIKVSKGNERLCFCRVKASDSAWTESPLCKAIISLIAQHAPINGDAAG